MPREALEPLGDGGEEGEGGAAKAGPPEDQAPAIQRFKPTQVRLVGRHALAKDCWHLRFALPSATQRVGLVPGQHITLAAQIGGERVVRPYTPVTLDREERGFFGIVVRVYRAGVDPRHPEGGKMSQYLDRLGIGEEVEVRGPHEEFAYLGGGRYRHKGIVGRCLRINLVGGGTGIAPLFQIIKAASEDPGDPTELRLLYASRAAGDILLKRELEAAAQACPQRLRVQYVAEQDVPEGWGHERGRLSAAMMQAHLFGSSDGTLALVCGPDAMVEGAALPALQELGFTGDYTIVL